MTTNTIKNIGTIIRKHPHLIRIVIITLIIFSIITFLPPILMHWQIKKQLKAHGEDQVKIAYVLFNPLILQFRIHSLFAEKGDRGHVQWNRMIFDINIWPLWKKRLVVNNFILNNAQITLHHPGPGEWILGGIRFRTNRPGNKNRRKNGWEFGITNLDLTNVRLLYSDSLLHQEIFIVHAQIDTFMSWMPQKHTNFSINTIIDDGKIKISGKANPLGKNRSFSFKTTVDSLPLQWFAPVLGKYGINKLNGILNASYSVHGMSSRDTSAHLNATGKLSLNDVHIIRSSFPFSISVSELSMNGDNTFREKKRTSTSNQLHIVNALCTDNSQNIILFNFNKGTFTLTTTGMISQISLDNCTINNLNSLALFHNKDSFNRTTPYSIKLNTLSIDTATFSRTSGLNFGSLAIQNLKLDIVRLSDGNFMFKKNLSSYSKPNSSKKPLQVYINDLRINKNSRIQFNDQSTTPNVIITASDADISLQDFAIHGKSIGKFAIRATVDTFANLHATGTVESPTQGILTALNSRIQEFNLVKISPYLKDLFGYDFKTGHLNASLDGTVRDNKLDINSAVTLREITVSPVDTAEAFKKFSNIILGISFKTALEILTDNNGNVHLNIPVSGNISDPDFNILDIIRTATFNGLKGGVNSFFGAAGNVFTPDQKTSFKPVTFKAQSVTLTRADSIYLDSLAKRILKHPDIPINLCGMAVINEFDTSFNSSDSLDQEQKNRLLDLALQRSTVVKRFLIRKKVPSEQLFLCAPQVDDSKNEQPRVEIKLGIESVE
ncbi:MAG: DUF748 domain-containing protein [Fibrobacter sp.]|nr:DUF748 domain-containing protein [Fibrobacter sp.]